MEWIVSAMPGWVLASSSIHCCSARIFVFHLLMASGCSHWRTCISSLVSSPHRGHIASGRIFHFFSVVLVAICPENSFTIPIVLVFRSFAAACSSPSQFICCWLRVATLSFERQKCLRLASWISWRMVWSNACTIRRPFIHTVQCVVCTLCGTRVSGGFRASHLAPWSQSTFSCCRRVSWWYCILSSMCPLTQYGVRSTLLGMFACAVFASCSKSWCASRSRTSHFPITLSRAVFPSQHTVIFPCPT